MKQGKNRQAEFIIQRQNHIFILMLASNGIPSDIAIFHHYYFVGSATQAISVVSKKKKSKSPIYEIYRLSIKCISKDPLISKVVVDID